LIKKEVVIGKYIRIYHSITNIIYGIHVTITLVLLRFSVDSSGKRIELELLIEYGKSNCLLRLEEQFILYSQSSRISDSSNSHKDSHVWNIM